jgi:hypothetical protein
VSFSASAGEAILFNCSTHEYRREFGVEQISMVAKSVILLDALVIVITMVAKVRDNALFIYCFCSSRGCQVSTIN